MVVVTVMVRVTGIRISSNVRVRVRAWLLLLLSSILFSATLFFDAGCPFCQPA